MLKRAHRWLGLTAAAWLVLATTSGMLLLFKDEYYGWRYRELPDSSTTFAPDAAVIEAIVDGSARRLSVLGQPTASLPAYHAYFADGGEALFHPETGREIASWDTFDALPALLFELHVYMLLGTPGHVLVGVAGLLGAANIAIGLVLWWRRRRLFLLRHAIPRNAAKRYLIRSHAAQGALLGAILFVSLVSGSAVVFPRPATAGLAALLGSAETLRPTVRSLSAAHDGVDWQRALASAGARFPNAELRFVTPAYEPDRPLVLRLRNAGELHPNGRSYAVIHPSTGEILESIDATRVGLGPAVYDALYPIHAAKTGWPGHRLLWLATSLALFFIAASGTYLYLSRRSLSRGHADAKAVRAHTRRRSA